jgi:glycosyltransferase involved in cell wall biosynthesis
VGNPKFSIVIPYRDRLDNLRISLASLADQTLPGAEFEVVVGVMEYSDKYLAICREYLDHLNIVSVLSARPWQVGYARNLAMRQATGDILVLMDVDMAIPSRCLEDLHDRYFGYGQNVCVIGQMIDYDNNTGDVAEVHAKPYEHYRKVLDDIQATGSVDADPRLRARHVIPWSFAWTALIALPRTLVGAHDLTFDLAFRGYGVEDLEWAYRVSRTSTPMIVARDFFGMHLPHVRDVNANRRTEALNYRYFLRKWPGADVELACAFGDFEANEAYLDFRREIERVVGAPGASLAVLRATVDGESQLVVGLTVDASSRLDGATVGALPDGGKAGELLPIAGVALPYEDDSIDRCRILPPVLRLAGRYKEKILAEAHRVSRTPPSTAGD